MWEARVLVASLVRKVRPEEAAIQNRVGHSERRMREAARGQREAVVGPAAREHEVRELAAQAADRLGAERVEVVWAVLEPAVALAGVGAVELAAEQGNKSRLFLARTVALELSYEHKERFSAGRLGCRTED